MRRFSCILMCLTMASMASALSITNGDFEVLGIRENVPEWFDHSVTYLRLRYSPNGTQYMGLADSRCWAYQSIGYNTEGVPALQIQYDIGAVEGGWAEEPVIPRDLVLTVSIYESDGSFVGADELNIYGANGVKLIDTVTVSYPAMEVGKYITDSVTLQYIDSTSGELFLRFKNEGDGVSGTEDRFAIDNVQIAELPSIVNPFPKDGTGLVAVELNSPQNDLIFTVTNEDIIKVDVLFGPDPNLSEIYKIVDGMSVSPGQYTITLETEYPQNLTWSTEYFWSVLAYAYDPNGTKVELAYTSPIWSFTTIQEGPLLGNVTPAKLVARIGKDAVLGLTMSSKVDTFQWYKEGDPAVALTNGTKYAGVDTDTLTILNAQPDDAGFYYCIGEETATGLSAQSSSRGELRVGELKSHYPFETTYTVGADLFTPDIISGKDMQLMGGASLSDEYSLIDKNLLLVNPSGAKLQWARILDTTVAHYEDITIACWVRPTTLINSNDRDRWNRVWDFGDNANEAFFLTMLYRQNDPRQGGWDVARSEWNWYTIEDGQSVRHNQELDVESEIDPEVWYYVVVTVEDGYGRIYLNGECGTENKSPQGLTLQSPIGFKKTYNYIGKAVGADVPYLNARIDDFRIYNYALTKQEIAEEYNRVTGVESICDLEIYDLYDWDFNRNCKIDLPDFAEIAAKWLVDYRIFPD